MLDLGSAPILSLHQPPQGYFHAADDAALLDAVLQLRESVGEFEKPKFFQYKHKICAHSRNEQIGCTACIDVCSAEAIRSDASMKGKTSGGGIIVEPHLCVGCGACTTVCPSGAISYATPRANEQGRRIRTLLTTYQRAGGADAALLIHSQGAGARAIGELGRAARVDPAVRGLPARVLPLDVWHTASVGIDLWLAAIAYGASQVWVLMTDEEAPGLPRRGRRADGSRADHPQRSRDDRRTPAHRRCRGAAPVGCRRRRAGATAGAWPNAATRPCARSMPRCRRRRPPRSGARRASACRPTSERRSSWRSTT